MWRHAPPQSTDEKFFRQDHYDYEGLRKRTYQQEIQEIANKNKEPVSADDPDPVCAAHVEEKPVEWLWPGRLARGMLTLLDGDPGVGKSLISLQIAAQLTTPLMLLPGIQEMPQARHNVIIASAEDDFASVIKPRLIAARAHLECCFLVGPRQWAGLRDTDQLRRFIRRYRASLVVLDPLLSWMPYQANTSSFTDVHLSLKKLADAAASTGAAVLMLRHLRKSGAANPLYRGLGSIGLIGMARMALLAARDPANPRQCVLASTKSNLTYLPASCAYRVYGQNAQTIEWLGPSPQGAENLIQVSHYMPLEEACIWLQKRLNAGVVPSRQLLKEASMFGFSRSTIFRAKQTLGVRSAYLGEAKDGTVWGLHFS